MGGVETEIRGGDRKSWALIRPYQDYLLNITGNQKHGFVGAKAPT